MKRQILSSILILLAVGGFAAAATITVDDDGPADFNNIQAAIDAAVDGVDEVVVADGNYSGVGNYDLNFRGKAITVKSANGPANCIIDCNGMGRGFGFYNDEGAGSIVDGFTIKNGDADYGGGIDCYYASPTIINCVIRDNHADFDGGGVACYEGLPTIKNCLFLNNSTGYFGGAINCDGSSSIISNCTFIGNSASGDGGGVYCYYYASPQIINSIFEDCSRHAIYEDSPDSDPVVSHCLFYNNPDGDYYDDDTGQSYTGAAQVNSITGNSNNIDGDPLFRTGPLGDYYLSQIAGGQLADSNCVNTGSGTAASRGLASYTTATNNTPDGGTVDRGYHYHDSGAVAQYYLTTSVAGGNGSMVPDPNGSPHGPYDQFSEVAMTALPDVGYKVKEWTGAENVPAAGEPNNVVTITEDKTVTVEFEPRIVYQLTTIVVNGIGGTIDPNSGPQYEGDIVLLTAAPEVGYTVIAWTGTDDDTSMSFNNYVTMDSDKTVTVEFIYSTVRLDTAVVGGNGGIRPRSGNYPIDLLGLSPVALLAIPDYGYQVKAWGGDANGVPFEDPNDPNTNSVIMNRDKSVTVEFEPRAVYYLTTSVVDGNGSIAPPSGPYYDGEVVNLAATPVDPNYGVKEWTVDGNSIPDPNDPNSLYRGQSYKLTMDGDKSVTVEFKSLYVYYLTTSVVGGNGSIAPPSRPCYDGEVVNLTATPVDPNYGVKEWTIDGNSILVDPNDPNFLYKGGTYALTMDSDKSVTVEFGPPVYQLTTSVTGGVGTIAPPSGNYFEKGTVVPLTATPGVGWRVKAWSGTDDLPGWNMNTNTVTMTSNKTVTVTFELDYGNVIHVPGDYPEIQLALDAAVNGDTIVISDGLYAGKGFHIDKNITITSATPEDPNLVVIDVEGGEWGFELEGAGGSGVCTISGLTVINANIGIGYEPAPDGQDPNDDGEDGWDSPGIGIYISGNHVVSNCVIRNAAVWGHPGGDGADGSTSETMEDPHDPDNTVPDVGARFAGNGGEGGDAFGAGIYIDHGNPLIRNTIIEDCFAIAGYGGDGGDGVDEPADPEQFDPNFPASKGGDGGVPGRVRGGGVYCGPGTWPTFENCIIRNNVAVGGAGGDGGDAGDVNDASYSNCPPGGYGGLTTEDPHQPDPWTRSALGAGVYVDNHATFTNCRFINNRTYGAHSGIGGDHPIAHYQQPRRNYHIPSFGAAVYCADGTATTFTDCTFQDNETVYGGYPGDVWGFPSDPNVYDIDGPTGFGAAISIGETAGGTAHSVIIDCNFAGNASEVGGAFYGVNSDLRFEDCNFTSNLSAVGGAMATAGDSIAEISGSIFRDNVASYAPGPNQVAGTGGGLFCMETELLASDCVFTGNFAYNSGGGVYLGGDLKTGNPALNNCLITKNTAGRTGGGVTCDWFVSPIISNCTIADNTAEVDPSYGGGLFCTMSSSPRVIDSIIWGNASSIGPELAVETWFGFAPTTLTVSYCDIWGGEEEAWVDDDSTLNWGAGNIDGVPLFVDGYYLSQVAAGQGINSPCVDAGSDLAVNLGMDAYSTRVDHRPDSNEVDMGYHSIAIPAGISIYWLTTEVIGGHGVFIEPVITDPNGEPYDDGTVVSLEVQPDIGWRVKAWSGTDDDSSTAKTNSVVMNSDRTVTVEFEQVNTLIVSTGGGEPGHYSNIQDAVSDAEDGDTIVVYPGIYYGGDWSVMVYVNKSITISSTSPDDPCCVAATVIDGYLQSPFQEGHTNIGITFGSNTDADTILNGFTIQNCGGHWHDGEDGDRQDVGPNGEDGGMGYGAAIRVAFGGGPVIKNCVIRDNVVIGGDGGDGAGATQDENAGRGGWGGLAWGGAVYCGENSSPTFINCRIIDNEARGGNGGDGGNDTHPGGEENYGGNWSRRGTPGYPAWDIDPYRLNITAVTNDDLWHVWGYLGDYRWYSGYGGGVFCGTGSTVTFTDCTISGNLAQGGMSGQGGLDYLSERPEEPLIPYEIPSFGGGVYCATDSTVTFTDCTITDNISSEPNVPPNNRLDPYLGHGGGVCAEDAATVIFTDCTFSENEAAVGGGIHFADANAVISDCNFTSNLAFHGGGLFGEHGPATVLRSNFTNNIAVSDPNEPNVVILGEGGGLHLWATEADIIDCNIKSNQAEASGGGVFFGGEGAPSLTNCLLTNNTAGRDGGGVSASIFTQLTVSKCTIADNIVTGAGYGGGLYGSYGSYTKVIDNIIWGNWAQNGAQIAIGISTSPSTVDVSYSDVQGAQSGAYVEAGCILNWPEDVNNLYTDPLFVSGPLGDYYLSQIGAGQSQDSPCVEAGSSLASHLGMNRYTTRTDQAFDTGIVDMGYHYPFTSIAELCKFCDLFYDSVINFHDFAKIALQWLGGGCSGNNDWCLGADLTFDTYVNLDDAALLAECWLVSDTSAPLPRRSEWAVEPHSSSTTAPYSISMTAETAFDSWSGDVEYYFECAYGDCNDSGWQGAPNYTDSDLDPNTEYGYMVRARDGVEWIPDDGTGERGNKTEWSLIGYAITGEEAPLPDTTPPSPDPMTWAAEPYISTPNTITLFSTTATDDTSSVEYYFENYYAPAYNSGWIGVPTWTDTGLTPDTTYTYRVWARDTSVNRNQTGWSAMLDANTLPEGEVVDENPPAPVMWDPNVTNGGLPYETGSGSNALAHMTAAEAIDPEGNGVEYYFECVEVPGIYPAGYSSGWMAERQWDVSLPALRGYNFRFKVRDLSPNYNESGWSTTEICLPFF